MGPSRFAPIDLGVLRTLLRQAAFVGLPTATLGLFACDPCPPDDHLFLLRNPNAEIRPLIDNCSAGSRVDCLDLCDRLVRENLGFSRGGAFDHCEVHSMKDGYFQVHAGWENPCPGGRRPEGFQAAVAKLSPVQEGRDRVAGALLADMAQMESASVPAFLRLRDELERHGAPRSLSTRAQSAARDEVRHARSVTDLAHRHGAETPAARVPSFTERPLVDMLIENAVEGCVHETYGAVLAHRQAVVAADPEIRRAMRTIAEDETRHAALAWDVLHWGAERLDRRTWSHVMDAGRRALADLRITVAREAPASAQATLGLPSGEAAPRIAARLTEALWS
jgi:rubrerythrin